MKYFQFCPVNGVTAEQAFEAAKTMLVNDRIVNVIGSPDQVTVSENYPYIKISGRPKASRDKLLYGVDEEGNYGCVDSGF